MGTNFTTVEGKELQLATVQVQQQSNESNVRYSVLIKINIYKIAKINQVPLNLNVILCSFNDKHHHHAATRAKKGKKMKWGGNGEMG